MRFSVSALILVLGALSACDAPTKAAETPRAERVHRFEIAGVHLGMNVAETRAALEQRGFKVDNSRGAWSYDDKLGEAVADAKGQDFDPKMTGVGRLWALNGGERVDVEFRPLARGGLAYSISYSSPANGRSREQMAAEVEERYGRSLDDVSKTSVLRICAASEPSCRSRAPELNYITFQPRDTLKISLFPGSSSIKDWDAQFGADVKANVGAQPSSF